MRDGGDRRGCPAAAASPRAPAAGRAPGHRRRGRPRIEATESRYPADRYALDVNFDVEAPDPGRPADAGRSLRAMTAARRTSHGRLVLDDASPPAGSHRGRVIAAVELDAGRRAARRPTSPRASSTSMSMAGAATTPWAGPRRWTGWPAPAAPWRDLVPADRCRGADGLAGGLRRARPRLDPAPPPTAPTRSASTSRARSFAEARRPRRPHLRRPAAWSRAWRRCSTASPDHGRPRARGATVIA